MTKTAEIEITKEEYLDDSEDWEDKLIKKYGLNAEEIVDSQRNFDGEKYTYDVWLRKLKAVFKDDCVRCEKCGTEIWEGVDCDCGVDGSDHEGLKEAYEEKAKAIP